MSISLSHHPHILNSNANSLYNILPEIPIPTRSGVLRNLNEYPNEVLLTLREISQQLCKRGSRAVSTSCQIPAELVKEAGLVASDSSYHLQQQQGSTDLALRKLEVFVGNVEDTLSQMVQMDIRDRIREGLDMVRIMSHLSELLEIVRMTATTEVHLLKPSRLFSDIPGGEIVIEGAGYVHFGAQYRWIRDEDTKLKLEIASRLLEIEFRKAVNAEFDKCSNDLQLDRIDLARLAIFLPQDNVTVGGIGISRLERLLRLAGFLVTPHPTRQDRFYCSFQSGVTNNDLRRKYVINRVRVAQEKGELT